MISLTRKTDYALVALVHLARMSRPVSSAREISDRYRVPLPLLMNILKTLTQSGIVRSVRGARGGYALAVGADEITLDGLIEAMEGPIGLVQCARMGSPDRDDPCELIDSCPVTKPIHRVNDRLRALLSQVTLSDVTSDDTQPPGEVGSADQ